MGNCLFGGGFGGGDVNEVVIKVVTSNGGIMEFFAPITVEFITDEFPGHGIFRSHDLFWNPLPHQELLQAGEYYYLLPLDHQGEGGIIQVGHVRSNSFPAQPQPQPQTMTSSSSSSLMSQLAVAPAPYRMSFDSRRIFKRTTHAADQLVSESDSSSSSSTTPTGFWKVKLVITPQQLLEILSQEARTQELIESVRTVAKCGNGISSGFFPDQWSLTSSSTRNASSKKDVLLEF